MKQEYAYNVLDPQTQLCLLFPTTDSPDYVVRFY
jgi:hypothetical protein